MIVQPQRTSCNGRIDAVTAPPRRLVAGAMRFAMPTAVELAIAACRTIGARTLLRRCGEIRRIEIVFASNPTRVKRAYRRA
jgi:hypothetical protein